MTECTADRKLRYDETMTFQAMMFSRSDFDSLRYKALKRFFFIKLKLKRADELEHLSSPPQPTSISIAQSV